MYIDTYGMSLSGVLPLQHEHYDKPYGGLPGWDLDFRAHKRCVRIVGRWDTAGGLGQWIIDRDSVGDLCGGFCWQPTGRDARPVAYWSFAIPAVIVLAGQGSVATGGRPSVATPGGNAAAGSGIPVRSGPMTMIPVADKHGSPDTRMRNLVVEPIAMVGRGKAPQVGGGVKAGGNQRDGRGDILYVGLNTPRIGFTNQTGPSLQMGIGAPPISIKTPQPINPTSSGVRYANPAISALRRR